MNDIFHISRLIIKEKLKVLTNLEKTDLKSLNHKYPFSKEINIEKLVDRVSAYSEINKDKAWAAIEAKTQKTQSKPVFKLFNNPWYKYAAAAIVVGVLTTTYFFRDNLFNTSQIKNSPIIVNTDIIEPGINKATLTLKDGTVIALEKGNTYQTQNANSNGEEIIYEADKGKSNEIAYNYLTIPRGGQFHIVLSDGTEVWLNSESQLKYPVTFIEGETRNVELVYGEAYFDVSPSTEHKGARFKVFNKSQEIEVVGTEFNVKAYKDEANIYTTLVKGKVEINTSSAKQILMPNQQSNLEIVSNKIVVSEVDVKGEISWIYGDFVFQHKPLKDIMKVLSRWYDIDIEIQNKSLETVKFNGELSRYQNLEDILLLIKNTHFINQYELTNEKIILK